MITVVGHKAVRKLLEDELPPVVLFLGPTSIGKRTLALYLTQYHEIDRVDFLEIHQVTVNKATELSVFSRSYPFGERKLAIVHLDGMSENAANDLLKLLEEPPSYMRFILIASCQPLPTVVSRSNVFRMGRLPAEELKEVLVRFNGVSPESAEKVKHFGQVLAAKTAHQKINSWPLAVSLVKSIEAKDVFLFRRAFKAADGDALKLFEMILFEAATGDWNLFDQSDFPIIGKRKDVARQLLSSLSQLDGARRSLSARVVLEQVVRRT